MEEVPRGGCIDFLVFLGVLFAIMFGIWCGWLLANIVF